MRPLEATVDVLLNPATRRLLGPRTVLFFRRGEPNVPERRRRHWVPAIWMKRLTRHDTFIVEVLLWIFSQEAGDNSPASSAVEIHSSCPLYRNVIATMLLLRTKSDTEFDTDR